MRRFRTRAPFCTPSGRERLSGLGLAALDGLGAGARTLQLHCRGAVARRRGATTTAAGVEHSGRVAGPATAQWRMGGSGGAQGKASRRLGGFDPRAVVRVGSAEVRYCSFRLE